MSRGRIDQLVPIYSWGDAIGGITGRTRAALRGAGFESTVYAELIDGRLQREARPASEMAGGLGAADTLIYHLSIGHDALDRYLDSPARRVLIYHNITPAHYYADVSAEVADAIERGREQLAVAAAASDLCIALSEFSADEIRATGAACSVIPPLLDLERLRPRRSRPTTPPEFICVGRLAANKRPDVAIRAIAAARSLGLDARLTLIGGSDDTGPYAGALRRLISLLGVEDLVDLGPAKLSDRDLGDRYARATALLVPSEHEGFCVPLVEAMAFSLPLITGGGSAVAQTLGEAGLDLGSDDPILWASAIQRVNRDRSLAARMAAASRQRLSLFEPGVVAPQWVGALSAGGDNASPAGDRPQPTTAGRRPNQ